MNTVKLPIRRTKMGGLTENLVFSKTPEGWRRVKPINTVMSRTGHHGEETYEVGDDYIIIIFNISNSGKRYIDIRAGGEGKVVVEKVKPPLQMWEEGFPVKARQIEALLNS
jgi:hypothetical protein